MTYPESAKVNGEIYPLNTDYRVGLRCMQVCNDPDITDVERALAIVCLLFGFVPSLAEASPYVDMAIKFLQCGKEQEKGKKGKTDFDFEYDRGYIEASFQSDYGIALSETKMHWWRYMELLNGLTEHSVLNRVRDLRNYDLSEIKDAKQRRKMADAKASVALPRRRTKAELEDIADFERLLRGGEIDG